MMADNGKTPPFLHLLVLYACLGCLGKIGCAVDSRPDVAVEQHDVSVAASLLLVPSSYEQTANISRNDEKASDPEGTGKQRDAIYGDSQRGVIMRISTAVSDLREYLSSST